MRVPSPAADFYFFGPGRSDGSVGEVDILGSKGANLAEMARIGVPVPFGFTVPTRYCVEFFERNCELDEGFCGIVLDAIRTLEELTGRTFARGEDPLLLSIRSGAKVSMPGMMETVLNLGVTEEILPALERRFQSRAFAVDTYRRFLEMYLQAVCGLPLAMVEQPLAQARQVRHLSDDADLDAEALDEVVEALKRLHREKLHRDFPQDPYEQLWATVSAVFKSWNSPRAKKYRKIHDVPDNMGTAINVCSMVFGNAGARSGSGVCFTRNPSTGERELFGEFLLNAQGEDVVAGIRTPRPISELAHEMSAVYDELRQISGALESHFRDVQDIEFTVENGKLWILQTRKCKCTVPAAFRAAVEMAEEGIISRREAISRIDPADFEKLLLPGLDPRAHKQVIGRGLAASPGAASGRIAFHGLEAERMALRGEDAILVREETSPDDIAGIHVARGLLTTRGGMTSHAAIIARQMGKCCVVGCGALQVLHNRRVLRAGSVELKERDWITIDGSTGDVILGRVATRDANMAPGVQTFLAWAESFHRMRIRANADTAAEALSARRMGARGIGLCRTERVFLEQESLPWVWRSLLGPQASDRAHALAWLCDFQRRGFSEILEAMVGQEVCIRLFDHPLVEFLPHSTQELEAAERDLRVPGESIFTRVQELTQSNPALGHRGVRLGIVYPEIYEMQIRALVEATASLVEQGCDVRPQLMLPFVSTVGEFEWARDRFVTYLKKRAASEAAKRGLGDRMPHIPFGAMIETPRAAILAHQFAKRADFLSIGCTDLTQLSYGLSRDDAAPFLRAYRQEGIFDDDPLTVFDEEGVGFLVRHACAVARKARPGIEIGVCTEHDIDRATGFYEPSLGLDYLSCSSFRVPLAVLNAAKAGLVELPGEMQGSPKPE